MTALFRSAALFPACLSLVHLLITDLLHSLFPYCLYFCAAVECVLHDSLGSTCQVLSAWTGVRYEVGSE